jgi:microsomal dipeptidase-like Zn-dependent dipeptidase
VKRAAIGLAAGAVLGAGVRAAGSALVARSERRNNRIHRPPPYEASARARELHRSILVADLHADSLLWGRDLLRRADRGHLDVPRMVEGGLGLATFAACVKVPRRLNIERNDDRTDDVTLLALAQGWPPATWRSLLARTLYMARRLDRMAAASGGVLRVICSRGDLATYLDRRREDPGMTAGLLSIEGAHALEGDPSNVDVVADAGFRMMSPSHFFDNEFGGSAHGVEKGGLTELGRELIERTELRSMLVDVAHASVATIDDVLAIARRPVVASHTGVRATCDNVRNLSDEHLRGIAATGGIVGIGFWPTVACGDDAAAIARSIRHAVDVAGIDHVGLGSDFDGAVPVPFDATGLVQVTDALLEAGFTDDEIGKVMGGNVVRLLGETLPD